MDATLLVVIAIQVPMEDVCTHRGLEDIVKNGQKNVKTGNLHEVSSMKHYLTLVATISGDNNGFGQHPRATMFINLYKVK